MMKIVLIGAGSAMFTRGLVADLIQRGEEIELALVDVDPEALSVAEGLARKMIAARQASVKLSAAVDRREVLKDASAVIRTVGVGARRAWEQDVFIPRKHGIYQPVGDTVGPGGTSRALRMIPAMVSIAQDVLDLAPTALFFNYGNPMAPVCRAIRKATGAEVVGLCHGVFHVGHYLARALGDDPGRLRYTAVGINHLTWFVEVRLGGQDAMPKLRAIAEERIARGVRPKEGETLDNPFTWHLCRLFHAFPAVLDRHVTEFFPQVRRDSESDIPYTVGRHSEEYAWVTQPTRTRKGSGQHSLLGKQETREDTENVVLQDPRGTVKARLPEVQSNQVQKKTRRYRV